MASRWSEIVIDCADPERLAAFWCAVLGWEVIDRTEEDVEILPMTTTDSQRLADLRTGAVVPSLLFGRSSDDKVGKNRLHLDLSPIDRSRDEEVERILALGATRADVGQIGEESWVVLADPEGNEFCVLRSLAEGEFELPS